MNCQIGKHSVKEMKVVRYLPKFKVYEISVTWQSQRLTEPTLFYLSEVFLYPYSLHPQNQKAQPLTGTQGSNDTQATVSALPTCLQVPNSQEIVSMTSIFDFHQNLKEDSKRQNPISSNKRVLDYDEIASNASIVSERQRRNQQVVVQSLSPSQPKKRNKLQ